MVFDSISLFLFPFLKFHPSPTQKISIQEIEVKLRILSLDIKEDILWTVKCIFPFYKVKLANSRCLIINEVFRD